MAYWGCMVMNGWMYYPWLLNSFPTISTCCSWPLDLSLAYIFLSYSLLTCVLLGESCIIRFP
ncbi:hypothetical protein DAI22_05g011850 [Oryza sativa Japonica Group]|nr:hypothetical protein DAI22_05g011850 [Oryza sativa Japonica Group]